MANRSANPATHGPNGGHPLACCARHCSHPHHDQHRDHLPCRCDHPPRIPLAEGVERRNRDEEETPYAAGLRHGAEAERTRIADNLAALANPLYERHNLRDFHDRMHAVAEYIRGERPRPWDGYPQTEDAANVG